MPFAWCSDPDNSGNFLKRAFAKDCFKTNPLSPFFMITLLPTLLTVARVQLQGKYVFCSLAKVCRLGQQHLAASNSGHTV